MQQIKVILDKSLDTILPATNEMTNFFVKQCLKTTDQEKGYARCMIKRMNYIGEREDELAQKLLFVKLKFDKCKRSNIKHVECVDFVKTVGGRSIEQYIIDIQKY